MNIIVCGAGQVGHYAAEVLAAAGHDLTVIDPDPVRVRAIGDNLDVRTLCGNAATAEALQEAGAAHADLVVAATSQDEINLLIAAIARGVGASRTIVRVHHSTFFEQRGLDYRSHLGIDRLICPEFSTAQTIASAIRNPGALAVEKFGRGEIEMQEFQVSSDAAAIGVSLAELGLPRGTRLAAVSRNQEMFIPHAASVFEPNDGIVLIGNRNVMEAARSLFHSKKLRRRKIVLMGGPPMAVWLCRALQQGQFSIRLFEINHDRAQQLADKLSWVTVIQEDPTDPAVFEEEKLGQADAFVGLLDRDEANILSCAWARSMGVASAIAVVQRAEYLHLLNSVGIDRAFSPRRVAVREIEQLLAGGGMQRIASLAEGSIDVYRFTVGPGAKAAGKALRDIRISPDWVVVAVQRGPEARVPSAEDTILEGDVLVCVGRSGTENRLRKTFAAE